MLENLIYHNIAYKLAQENATCASLSIPYRSWRELKPLHGKGIADIIISYIVILVSYSYHLEISGYFQIV